MEKQADHEADADTNGFKEVFKHVPSFGCYQKFLYFSCNFLVFSFLFQYFNLVFAFGAPQFHCADSNTTCAPNKCCQNCSEYSYDGPFISIVNEWNLVCKEGMSSASVQTVFFAGQLVSSFVSGMLTDAFGRRTFTFISAFLMIVGAFITSFATNMTMVICLQFFVGFFTTSTILAEYTYVMELTGASARSFTASFQEVYWKSATFVLILIVYFVRSWRLLLMLTNAPFVLMMFLAIFVPESPRWLIAKGRLEQARAVLTKYAGKKAVDQEKLKTLIEAIREKQIENELHSQRYTIIDLFRTPKMRKWCLIMGFSWFTVNFCGIGFILFTKNLAGNLYLNYTLMGIVPFVLLPVSWLFVHRAGRRMTHVGIMLISGVLCLVVMAIPNDYPGIATGIAIVGKGTLGCGWITIYLIVSELFPTTIRTTALGMSSVFGRVGSLAAPYVVMLSEIPGVSLYIPVTIFGIVSTIAGIATFWVPETIHATMAQTIEEAESRADSYRLPWCGRKKSKEEKYEEVEIELDSPDEKSAMMTDSNA